MGDIEHGEDPENEYTDPFKELTRRINASKKEQGEKINFEETDVSRELSRRREAGEIEPTDYEVNYIDYLHQMDMPVTRKDIGNHAVVIRPEEFESLGYIEFIDNEGNTVVIDFEDEGFDKSQPFVLFPENLGEIE